MLTFRVIARIDIKNNYVVKGLQFEGLRKLGDPNQFAKKYYEQGIDEILFVDSVASHYGRNNLIDIIKKCCQDIFVPITVCGGVRTLKDIDLLLKSGADKIGINTAGIKNPEFLEQAVKMCGSQSIVASIEVKRIEQDDDEFWFAYYDNGRESSQYQINDWINVVQDKGVGEILLSSVDCDGLMCGMDEDLINQVNCKVPLIIGSGVGKLEHLNFVKDKNIDAIAISSAFHYNKLDVVGVKEKLLSLGKKVRL